MMGTLRYISRLVVGFLLHGNHNYAYIVISQLCCSIDRRNAVEIKIISHVAQEISNNSHVTIASCGTIRLNRFRL